MRKRLACTLLSLATLTGCGVSNLSGVSYGTMGTNGSGRTVADWTVFVYMAGDNNLSSAAAKDVNEMEAGLSSDRVHFVVLLDQDKKGDSRILDIKNDPNGLNNEIVSSVVDDQGAVISADKEVDTGSPETLKRFLTWGTKRYTSRRSMLIMWNHGGEVFSDKEHLKSFCWDDQTNNHLNMVDLWRTSQQLTSKVKFDILGFDTCLLGHLETAYQFKNLSDFLLSSERTVPEYGFDYQAIAKILSQKSTIYPRELSCEIAKSFNASYQTLGEKTTISAVDLTKTKERLVPAVNDLAKNLQGVVADLNLRGTLTSCLYEANGSALGSGEDDALDLGYLCDILQKNDKLSAETRSLAAKVSAQLKKAVIANLTTNTTPGYYQGLKIYFSWHYNKAYADASHQFFGTNEWTKFLKAYDEAKAPGGGGGHTPIYDPIFPGPWIGPM